MMEYPGARSDKREADDRYKLLTDAMKGDASITQTTLNT